MVRKTGNVGKQKREMKDRKKDREKEQVRKGDEKGKKSRGDFKFNFEDERLQDQYMSAWNDYDKVLPNFPIPKSVGYIEAQSLVDGSNSKKLNEIKDVFSRDNDLKGDVQAPHHKTTFLDDIKKTITETSTSGYINKVTKGLKRAEKKTPKKIKSFNIFNSPSDVRYNYVYYSDHPQEAQKTV